MNLLELIILFSTIISIVCYVLFPYPIYFILLYFVLSFIISTGCFVLMFYLGSKEKKENKK